MAINYAPRIAVSWAEFEPLVQGWANRCQYFAVFEHQADSTVNRTHLHLLMIDCHVKAEQFKRMFHACLPGINRKGNDLWQWESKQTPTDTFLTYMSKGVHAPKFVKNFSPELVEERRQQWVITTPKAEISSMAKYDEYSVMKQQFFAEHSELDMRYMNFETIRKWVFHWYWKRDGRVPIPTCYKRNASSLMMAIGEKINKLEESANEVFNLWY